MKIDVHTKQRDYSVHIERGSLSHLNEYINCDKPTYIITDDGVPYGYVEMVMSQLNNCVLKVVPQGETSKSIEVYEECLAEMLEKGFSRKDRVLTLGGGVVGDLAGFVAASYMRGIEFVNIPTTTLSQIDSSIGGKTAVNMNGIKNCIGAFWQPSCVIIDPNVCATLTKRHYHNGLIEALKGGLIADMSLFECFEQDEWDLDMILYKAVDMKRKVVEVDERESGLRKILNFGHTIGHGYESYYGMSGYYHGECVGLGMLDMLEGELKDRTMRVLERMKAPVECDADMHQVLDYVRHDKKSDHDHIEVVMVKELGRAEVVKLTWKELEDLGL